MQPRCSFLFFFAAATAPLVLAEEKLPPAATREVDFVKDIQPIFAANCISCHGPKKQKGGYRLDQKSAALRATATEKPIIIGKSAESSLIVRVAGHNEDTVMPPDGDTLSAEQVGLLRAWIDQGAKWPVDAATAEAEKLEGWALKPLAKPPVPATQPEDAQRVRNPIDAFVLAKLKEKKLTPTAEASRKDLLRRVSFDLIGLPPTPEEMDAFIADSAPNAYEKVVERLLASPRYGERWARHWMDVVHFGETHGHDQDRVRPNAWPYRDYLITAFNNDTPYARFIQEQVAADVLFPDEPQLTPALGFAAAGPWDESSLRDIRDDAIDRQIGYYLDRDDMVSTVMSAFTSSTVHCARCHDHKFDPIPQKEYYALQAVFAGVGRADREYDADPTVGQKRKSLTQKRDALKRRDPTILSEAQAAPLQSTVDAWAVDLARKHRLGAHAHQSWSVLQPDSVASSEGATLTLQADKSVLASGGNPLRDNYTIVSRVPADLKTVTAVRLELLPDESLSMKGPGRQENGNLHLSEISISANGKPMGIASASADFNQEGWTIQHAIDTKMESAWGIYPEVGKPHWAAFVLKEAIAADATITVVLQQQHGRNHCIGRFRLSATDATNLVLPPPLPEATRNLLAVAPTDWTPDQRRDAALLYLTERVETELKTLPPPSVVYAVAQQFKPDAGHKPIDKPREVHLLKRGDILKPAEKISAGALSCVTELQAQFMLPNAEDEGARRAALAKWLSDSHNPIVWRSIVNRVWHHHFGRGIVASLNDFGRMGSVPTHLELLDWLAASFRDDGGSLKKLHYLMVTSATYRQASTHNATNAASDGDNLYLWRMNRTRLDAESYRDAVLQASGSLDLAMGGPSVQQFSMKPGPHVTPVLDYTTYTWDGPGSGRRSVYRFLFRTLPDPFMDALDCADASQITAARNVSITPLQALALLNNKVVLQHSKVLAARVANAAKTPAEQVQALYRVLLFEKPDAESERAAVAYVEKHGLPAYVRVMLNSNAFMFVD